MGSEEPIMVGPGPQCYHCGEEYGQHSIGCPYAMPPVMGGPRDVAAAQLRSEIAYLRTQLSASQKRCEELIDEIVRASYSNTVYGSLTEEELERARMRAQETK